MESGTIDSLYLQPWANFSILFDKSEASPTPVRWGCLTHLHASILSHAFYIIIFAHINNIWCTTLWAKRVLLRDWPGPCKKQLSTSPLWIFCSWNTSDSPGEDKQVEGKAHALSWFFLITAEAKKHPSCLLGKRRRCSSKSTRKLFCGIIACHFCIVTFWLKFLFRQGMRSEAWALLTLLSGCMAMKEAFGKSEIHISKAQSSQGKWIKEHGALNGLKNRAASDESWFVSSGAFLLLIFMVQNEGQCFKSSRKSQWKQCNIMASVRTAQARNHCYLISAGLNSQTHSASKGLFSLGKWSSYVPAPVSSSAAIYSFST